MYMFPQPGKSGYADWYEFKLKIKSNPHKAGSLLNGLLHPLFASKGNRHKM